MTFKEYNYRRLLRNAKQLKQEGDYLLPQLKNTYAMHFILFSSSRPKHDLKRVQEKYLTFYSDKDFARIRNKLNIVDKKLSEDICADHWFKIVSEYREELINEYLKQFGKDANSVIQENESQQAVVNLINFLENKLTQFN
ncbi:hypothetical protein ACJA23_00195 [Mycoplasma corogypsi]|uniref:hypothetical protein n=1 Tax=Mycoplasma corogypsi TaxID=2106 RepID=UPI003873692E